MTLKNLFIYLSLTHVNSLLIYLKCKYDSENQFHYVSKRNNNNNNNNNNVSVRNTLCNKRSWYSKIREIVRSS